MVQMLMEMVIIGNSNIMMAGLFLAHQALLYLMKINDKLELQVIFILIIVIPLLIAIVHNNIIMDMVDSILLCL